MITGRNTDALRVAFLLSKVGVMQLQELVSSLTLEGSDTAIFLRSVFLCVLQGTLVKCRGSIVYLMSFYSQHF